MDGICTNSTVGLTCSEIPQEPPQCTSFGQSCNTTDINGTVVEGRCEIDETASQNGRRRRLQFNGDGDGQGKRSEGYHER